jgi:hypothetical protein
MTTPMTVRAIFSCSVDGDSWLAYELEAIAADIPAAVRWIEANQLSPGPSDKPVHPIMTAANHFSFYGTRAEVELLDSRSLGGTFGYVIEEIPVQP